MFCKFCGYKLGDDARFCPSCGKSIEEKIEETKERNPGKKATKANICPQCGDTIPPLSTNCPSCGYEVTKREVASSVKDFYNTLCQLETEEKKIEAIKLFPIPNTKEEIVEFMLLASSNFDETIYATNKNSETIHSAWLSKIEQCYKKAAIMFKRPEDREQINLIYQQTFEKTNKIKKTKLYMLVGGIALIIISVLVIALSGGSGEGTSAGPLSYIGIALLAIGILLVVFGAKKKKTKQQIEEDKKAKENRRKR